MDCILCQQSTKLLHTKQDAQRGELRYYYNTPANTLQQLKNMLLPGGYLGVMTETSTHPRDFAEWWYHRDLTHVCFYNSATFHWIAQRYQMQIVHEQKNVCIFTA